MTHDELRKLCEEASPEPWVGWVLPSRSASDGPERGGVSGLPFINYDRCTYFKPQDARFIPAARTAVPALLDRIAELEAENAKLKEQLERWNAEKSSMNTTPSLPPTTGANSSS